MEKPAIILEIEKHIGKELSLNRYGLDEYENLIALDLSNLELTDISFFKAIFVSFSKNISTLERLYLDNNKISNIDALLDLETIILLHHNPVEQTFIFDDIEYIESIEIPNFWGSEQNKIDLEWKLDKNVNILIGNNGSGKSTLLKKYILNSFLGKLTPPFSFYILRGNVILNDKKLVVDAFGGAFKKNKATLRISLHKNSIPNIQLISTFEQKLKSTEAVQKLSESKVETDLDWELWACQAEFRRYSLRLSKKVENLFRQKNIDWETEREKIYANKWFFEQKINELFAQTHKKLLITDEGDLFFEKDELRLSPYELSSGEKQILVLMLRFLAHDQKPHIVLLDEPEVSLHLDWQVQLIDILQSLNPNAQLIIATHSPAIIKRGWKDKVVFMELNSENDKGILFNA